MGYRPFTGAHGGVSALSRATAARAGGPTEQSEGGHPRSGCTT